MTYAEFTYLNDYCWICGWGEWEAKPEKWTCLQIHHITRGAHRSRARGDPAGWIRCCNHCHEGALAAMPIARQLALKKIHDPAHYDRVKVNTLRRRAPDAVTEEEVQAEVEQIQEGSK